MSSPGVRSPGVYLAYTVQYCLKGDFGKIGMKGRRELVECLLLGNLSSGMTA